MCPVLVVDDELAVVQTCTFALHSDGIRNTRSCSDSRKVLEMMSAEEIDVILLDLTMPHISGQELLKEIAAQYPEIPVIIITGVNDIGVAVESMKDGAYGYLLKPIDQSILHKCVKNAMVFDVVSRHESKILSMDRFKAHIEENRATRPAQAAELAEGASAFAQFEELPTLKEGQRELVMEAMSRAQNNQFVAAGLLGITQSGLSKALKREGLS